MNEVPMDEVNRYNVTKRQLAEVYDLCTPPEATWTGETMFTSFPSESDYLAHIDTLAAGTYDLLERLGLFFLEDDGSRCILELMAGSARYRRDACILF